MIFIGIDPGVSGGIAVLKDDGAVIETVKMPDTIGDLLRCLDEYRDRGIVIRVRAMLEQVNAGLFAGKAGKMGVSSAFTFGRGFGRLETALQANRIPFDLVMPAKWQAFMGCRTHGDKNISKARAQALFPGIKVTHAIADALLIAEYCRRVHGQSKGRTDGKESEGGSERQKQIKGRVERLKQAIERGERRKAGSQAEGI